MTLLPRDQRHQYLRFKGLQYTEGDIADYETRLLAKIYKREVYKVQLFDFGGLPDLMAMGLSSRMLMEYRDAQGYSVFPSRAWRRLFDIRGLLVHELILEFFSTFRLRARGRDLSAYWIKISSVGDFLGTPPSYTLIKDPILRLCHRIITCSIARRSQAAKKVTKTDLLYLRGMDVGSINVPYLLARYLRLFASGRKQGVMISGDLLVINMAELARLQICIELDDTWDWVAPGPERQPDAAAGTLETAEDAPVADEDVVDVLAPVQAP
uniref:Uncharacterized protein n=1 Tax=Tanacetum cinerariifolium TaxID=118510 RepID=A0A699KHA7_TANCI|nr:hypothetical protein [Tanacetum cinerariifolium]